MSAIASRRGETFAYLRSVDLHGKILLWDLGVNLEIILIETDYVTLSPHAPRADL
jgi:hypothetical protein